MTYESNAPRDPSQGDFGERLGTDTLRFTRSYPVPVERVWAALTTPKGLGAWLGTAVRLELVPGGALTLAFDADDFMDGHIREIAPPHRLVIDWHETANNVSRPFGRLDGDISIVCFELTAQPDGGTTLVLTHGAVCSGKTIVGFGAGWHAHLAALGAVVTAAPPIDRAELFAQLEPHYALALR